MELVCAILFILTGGILVVLFLKARARNLPMNQVVGLRTRAIMVNEYIWKNTHEKYAGIFLADGIIFLLCGLVFLISVLGQYRLIEDSSGTVIVLSAMGIVLLITTIGGIMADQFAKKMLEQDY